MKTTITTLAALASVASAHFTMEFPTVRGFDEDKLTQWPCGAQDTVGIKGRTPFPMTGGEIALTMGHDESNIEVVIALGNSGTNFNTILKSPISQTGLGTFCMTGISIPSSLNVTEGQNATIQVLTNGDPTGGLYNCADITFSSTATLPACKNNTGITAVAAANANAQPNGTTSGEGSPTTGGASTTSSTSSPSATKNAAVKGLAAGLGGLAMAGVAALAIVL